MALRSFVASAPGFPAGAAACTGLLPACIESGKEAAGFTTGTTAGAAGGAVGAAGGAAAAAGGAAAGGAAQAVGNEGTAGMALFVGICPVEVRWVGEQEVSWAPGVGDAETKSAKSNSPRLLLSVLGVVCPYIAHGELTALGATGVVLAEAPVCVIGTDDGQKLEKSHQSVSCTAGELPWAGIGADWATSGKEAVKGAAGSGALENPRRSFMSGIAGAFAAFGVTTAGPPTVSGDVQDSKSSDVMGGGGAAEGFCA